MTADHIDGLGQERRNSSVLAMELRLACTNPSIWGWYGISRHHVIHSGYNKVIFVPITYRPHFLA